MKNIAILILLALPSCGALRDARGRAEIRNATSDRWFHEILEHSENDG